MGRAYMRGGFVMSVAFESLFSSSLRGLESGYWCGGRDVRAGVSED